ncbi:MAG TPA: ABC transporter permease, partial [Planctomycetota bacterium]|nr:ABC transporter permease [Planctomycetota bacterium]
ELRSYFNSPIAYVFLVLFLGAALAFFFHDVWAVGQANLRGLFDMLPLLMVFLVPALTMRLWSEERKVGTFEVLLTLPLTGAEVVVGKFLASLALVGLALALTGGTAITMAAVGTLDWGPVIGGYCAALLLGAAYLAIGLLVSSLTENQILAFLATLAVCFALWLVGEEFVTKLFPVSVAGALEKVGTGARFRSVGRGVLDLGDLAYYATLVVSALAANAFTLEWRKG